MKKSLQNFWLVLLCLYLLLNPLLVSADNSVSLVGELIDDYLFITDNGVVYEIGDTEKGAEVLTNITDQRIKITGTVQKNDDALILYVIQFEIINDRMQGNMTRPNTN